MLFDRVDYSASTAIRVVVTFLAVLTLSVTLFQVYGVAIAKALVPLWVSELRLLSADFIVDGVRLIQHETDVQIQCDLRTYTSYVLPNGRQLEAGTSLQSSTSLGHGFQELVIFFSLTFASVPLCHYHYLRTFTVLLVGCLTLLLLDVPFVLLGAAEDLLRTARAIPSPHLYSLWMELLNNGGRAALGIVAALAVIWLGHVREPYQPV